MLDKKIGSDRQTGGLSQTEGQACVRHEPTQQSAALRKKYVGRKFFLTVHATDLPG